MTLQKGTFGIGSRGVIDTANQMLDLTNALADGKNLKVAGANQVLCRKGTSAVMSFIDDGGGSVGVTSIRGITQYKDRAVVVGHSIATNKSYLYVVKADFSGWYANDDTLTSSASALPTVVLWASQSTAPDVTFAEGLGILFIAHASAADPSGLNWPTKRIGWKIDGTTSTWQIGSLTSDLDASGGAETLYFAGVIAYQQHLWGWGFGGGAVAATGYDPSKVRWSNAIFATNDAITTGLDYFSPQDSTTLGDRVSSLSERVIAAAVAGNYLYLFSSRQVTTVTGYGRDTWRKQALEKSYGIIGPKAVAVAGDTVYWWSNRGPIRAQGNQIDPLWDAIANASTLVEVGGNPAGVIAGFDRDADQIVFLYQPDGTTGMKQFAAFDTRRNIWLGPDSRYATAVACAGAVDPVFSISSPPSGPSGPPTSLLATGAVSTTSCLLTWTIGDVQAQTTVEHGISGSGIWTVDSDGLSLGTVAYNLTGLTANTLYSWRLRHKRNGAYSSYATGTDFTTLNGTCVAPSSVTIADGGPSTPNIIITWKNNEPGATTQILVAGPSAGAPSAGSYVIQVTAGVGVTSYGFTTYTAGKYWAKARHTKSGFVDSGDSNITNATITAPSGPH